MAENDNLKAQAHATAAKHLQDKYRDEYRRAADGAAEELGVTLNWRLDANERARRDLNRILDENPHLLAELENSQ